MKNKLILSFLLIALSFNAVSPLLANKENTSKNNLLSRFVELSKKVGNACYWTRDFVVLFGSQKYDSNSYKADYKKYKDTFNTTEKHVNELLNYVTCENSNQQKLNFVQIIIPKLQADLEELSFCMDLNVQTLARYTDIYSHIEKVLTVWQSENKYNFGPDEIQIRDLNDCCNAFAKFSVEEFEAFTKDLELKIDEHKSFWKDFTSPRYKQFGLMCLDFIQSYLRAQALKAVVDECYEKITSELK